MDRTDFYDYNMSPSSPEELLEEIILVDDASDMDHVKEPLDNYMAQYPKARSGGEGLYLDKKCLIAA